MFEKYNMQGRRALFFGRYEASARDSRDIDTQHLLLGILRENDEATREFFEGFSVDRQQFTSRWPATVDRVSSSAELPLTEDAKKSLAYTAHIAAELGSAEITPLHLLLGILRVSESVAARSLAEVGVTWSAGSEAARQLFAASAGRSAAAEQTPIHLRASHYALLDRVAQTTAEGRNRAASREEVLLAIMDGLTANPERFPRFSSLDELRVRIAEAIASLPPADT